MFCLGQSVEKKNKWGILQSWAFFFFSISPPSFSDAGVLSVRYARVLEVFIAFCSNVAARLRT